MFPKYQDLKIVATALPNFWSIDCWLVEKFQTDRVVSRGVPSPAISVIRQHLALLFVLRLNMVIIDIIMVIIITIIR